MRTYNLFEYIPVRFSRSDYPSLLVRSFKSGHDGSIQFVARFLTDWMISLPLPEDALLMVAPSSSGKLSSIHQAARILLNHFNFSDGIEGFKRKFPVQSFCFGGWRRHSTIYESVEISIRVAGRDIILLDDVRTTGTTIDALSNMLMDAGAKTVTRLVVAQTVKFAKI